MDCFEIRPDIFKPDSTEDARLTRIVDGRRGVKVNHFWYWSYAFTEVSLHKKPINVRIDPMEVRFVYALVKGEWLRCESKLVEPIYPADSD
ncbi:MAG: hypothetical protein ACLPN1_08785 [Dissulfurispiraceae bacterium]